MQPETYHVTITAAPYQGFEGIAERVRDTDIYFVRFLNRPCDCIQGDIFRANQFTINHVVS
ncbi:hypothetical protein [Rhodoflexus caldus]|uniref:hypothetical protein n=1 Tax=Rhodoflexus caldus TaxID=2891236 RepID=UPI00202AAD6F|nr:hypothetical protein [Rhodoflexus caldus]